MKSNKKCPECKQTMVDFEDRFVCLTRGCSVFEVKKEVDYNA